jgi:isopenicillin N synthase-like dioxygenase
MLKNAIPSLDLGNFDLNNRSSFMELSQYIGDALRKYGFFGISGHGISADLVASAYHQAKQLFDLPTSVKNKYLQPHIIGQPRGYMTVGPTADHPAFEAQFKEFWHVGPNLDCYNPNVWPAECPQFEHLFSELYSKLTEVSKLVLDACSLYMGESDDYYSQMIRNSSSLLRLIHYPSLISDSPVNRMRAHQDLSLITIMCDPSMSGLQILDKDKNWHEISNAKNQLIINSGELLQYLSNDLFHCAYHQVVTSAESKKRRFSMPLFILPNEEVILQPSKQSIQKTSGQAIYPPVRTSDYLAKRVPELPKY